MKNNKKIVVPVLTAAAGLALLGGISGSVAWYQYNSRVTASIIGTSVANGGLLQISTTGAADSWGRDVTSTATGSTNDNKLLPVTFGATSYNGALPDTAHGYPEAGHAEYSTWTNATKGVEFVQYDIYLRAVKNTGASNTQLSAEKVYISDMVLDDATENKAVAEALRVHLHVHDENSPKNFLISKTGIVATADPLYLGLPMFGQLDLDGDNLPDTVGGYEWSQGRNEYVTYGANETYQTTVGMADVVAPRAASGEHAGEIVKQDGESDEHFAAKLICTTPDGSITLPLATTI